jgi:benzoylformate decarboxylase
MARAQGIEGEGPVMNSGDFAKALLRGEKIVRAGGLYVIDARVDVRTTEEADRGQTVGRKE